MRPAKPAGLPRPTLAPLSATGLCLATALELTSGAQRSGKLAFAILKGLAVYYAPYKGTSEAGAQENHQRQ